MTFKTAVLDANVFNAFFYETFKGAPHPERTGPVSSVFESLGSCVLAFVDEGGQLQGEWRAVAKGAEEWFDAWLADAFATGKLYAIEPSNDAQLRTRYLKLGFPGGRDLWYIRVAHQLTKMCSKSEPHLVAEDVDFFDPTQKKASQKIKLLLSGKGPVADQLEKDGIRACCIRNFTEKLVSS
jgi:hypothetical protein